MTKSAIILAGGFGTRLQAVVRDVPKPMAPVNGKPFLEYILNYLSKQGIKHCILSVGYKWETIQDYFGPHFALMKLTYVVEDEPLGTGGAIFKSVKSADDEEFFIINGDTFFAINLGDFYAEHSRRKALLSLALKPMTNFNRYGVVVTDHLNLIISFEEKRYYEKGNINGGIYLLNRKLFQKMKFLEKFSFEKDLMERYYNRMNFYGFCFNDYFIDIGIPEDYARAQKELAQHIKE